MSRPSQPQRYSPLLRAHKLPLQLIDKVLQETRRPSRAVNIGSAALSLDRSMAKLKDLLVHLPHATIERRAGD